MSERGLCSACGLDLALRADGTVRTHDCIVSRGVAYEGHRKERCPGSGLTPRRSATRDKEDES